MNLTKYKICPNHKSYLKFLTRVKVSVPKFLLHKCENLQQNLNLKFICQCESAGQGHQVSLLYETLSIKWMMEED